MSRILLTRPELDCAGTKQRLEAMGHVVVVAPMMLVQSVTFSVPDPARSLIVTSKNAVRYGLKSLPDIERVVYAVGDATAEAARELGFQRVNAGPGTVKGLMPLLQQYGSVPRPYTYLRGEDVSYDITGALNAEGGDAEDAIVYRAVAAPSFPSMAFDLINAGEIDQVLFYSPRLATIFEELVGDMDALDVLENLDAVCLSTRIADTLLGNWRSKRSARMPTEEAMMTAIGPA